MINKCTYYPCYVDISITSGKRIILFIYYLIFMYVGYVTWLIRFSSEWSNSVIKLSIQAIEQLKPIHDWPKSI